MRRINEVEVMPQALTAGEFCEESSILMKMKSVICDNRISAAMERRLQILGYYVIKLPLCSSLPEAISSHPDSLIFRLGDTFVTTCDYAEEAAYVFSDIREFSPDSRITFIDVPLGKSYPHDARLNAVSIGNHLITNTKTVAKEILEISEKQGFYTQNVNQGYPNCSILKINDENIITADAGIARKLEALGINALLITPGHISLPPYAYGFIGGASGVDGKTVYFLGDIMTHPDGKKITEFIENLGMKAVSLDSGELQDMGGIVFLP